MVASQPPTKSKPMKNITIIGASAGLGLETVVKSLADGHHVTSLSRSIENLPQHPNLTIVQGSATKGSDVQRAVAGANAIIVTIGTGTKIDWQTISKGTTLYTDAATVLLGVLTKLKMQVPLVVVTGFGAGNSKNYLPFFLNVLISLPLHKIYANKTHMEELLSSNYKNWVIVRPGVLTDKPAKGHYRMYNQLGNDVEGGDIARADVANFLVSQAVNPTEIGHYVVLMGN